MEVKPNECNVCTDVIKDGEEYHECTNPKNVENPHKVCENCYQGLKKGYDYDEEILDPQALLPSPRLNANGAPMFDARGNPIMMSRDELIAFYKTQKHATHSEGCPMKDGNLVKKTMGQPVTLKVMDKPAARGGIQDDDYDYDDSFYNRQLQQALHASLQPSRQQGQGAAVRRPQAAAAAAAREHEPDEPQDVAFRNALLESTRGTETPIQQIHRELNRRGIQVSEEDVRRIFQQMSQMYPENDYRARIETENYFVPAAAAARNPPPPPPVQTPPPSYDELLRNRELYPQLPARQLPQFQPPPLPPLPPGWRSVRNPDGVQFYAGPNGEAMTDFPWDELYRAYPGRYGGKKSRMSKSRRGKKSKMTKSRKGKKSKMTRKKV